LKQAVCLKARQRPDRVQAFATADELLLDSESCQRALGYWEGIKKVREAVRQSLAGGCEAAIREGFVSG
jgi:hypothetical protein